MIHVNHNKKVSGQNTALAMFLALLALPVMVLEPLTFIVIFALLLVIVYALGKLKLLATVLAIFAAFLVAFLIMSAVPALQVEPVYSLLKQFFTGLPEYVRQFIDYISRLLGGLTK